MLSYGSILLILGYINYNRSDNFYFFPTQTIDNLYNFFLPSIEMKNQNYNSVLEAKNVLMSKKLNFADKNNLDLNNESDRIIFYKWQREKAIEAILKIIIDYSNRFKVFTFCPFKSYKSCLREFMV